MLTLLVIQVIYPEPTVHECYLRFGTRLAYESTFRKSEQGPVFVVAIPVFRQ